jgi:hypothetical protein
MTTDPTAARPAWTAPLDIETLLKHTGHPVSVTALAAGKVIIDWYYAPKGAHLSHGKPKRVLIAAVTRTFPQAESLQITIKLTESGKRLLRRNERLLKRGQHLDLTAYGTFVSADQPRVLATAKFLITR